MRRTISVAALAILALAATHAGAAPKPQLTDPKGDYAVEASADIVSATLSTIPKGTKEQLQIAVVFAAPIAGRPPYTRTLGFTVGDCEFSAIHFGHGTPAFSDNGVGCSSGDATTVAGTMKIKGSTITFLVPLTGALKRGAKVTDLHAATAPSGMLANSPLDLAGDTATGSDWVIGSDRPIKKKK